MAAITDEAMVVATVYAESMLDLAEQVGEGDFLLEELLHLAQLLEQDDALARFFSTPTVDTQTRKESIEKIFRGRASDILVNSLQVLNEKERLDIFSAVAVAYQEEHRKLRGQVQVEVVTAVPLAESARERIKAMTAKYAGKEVLLVERIDESLVGGLIVQLGDKKFDGSVVRGIRRMNEKLHDRAISELQTTAAYVERQD
ncbi:MAG: ATP synthase F1 subunit delta [Planctomycetota bacterium]|jgi:F-type H+-transporting ATPase subunit delta